MKAKRRRKRETSKILAVICMATGIGSIAAYYVAAFMDKSCDSAVAVAGMTQVIASILSYCLYQFGLKNSRNKYGVDSDGQPFQIRNVDPCENQDGGTHDEN